MKCAATTQLKVLFNDPWLIQTSHYRLKGEVPFDRENNVLALITGQTPPKLYRDHVYYVTLFVAVGPWKHVLE